MYEKTDNPYKLKYLVTGQSGDGIPEIYLPEQPPDKEILWHKEQKFTRDPLPPEFKRWDREFAIAKLDYEQGRTDEIVYDNPDYLDIMNREWDRRNKGIFFWNGPYGPAYMTGPHYTYCTWWKAYFGLPGYRATDMEIAYVLSYIEKDPFIFGILLNTMRRYGKTSWSFFWPWEYISRTQASACGMQGEKEKKIRKTYLKFMLRPFLKMPEFFKPIYDRSTTQKEGISFKETPTRGKAANFILDVLESEIDYRETDAHAYDGDEVNRMILEEPGKWINESLLETWDVIKWCLKKGKFIVGKALFPTTVDRLDLTDKGGKDYQKVYYMSDFDRREENGMTESWLITVFLPADCALEGGFNENGHPEVEENRAYIIKGRPDKRKNAKGYANQVRKEPLTQREIFYVNPDKCEFNADIIQERIEFLLMNKHIVQRFDLNWKDGKRFGQVVYRRNEVNGRFWTSWLPDRDDQLNLVEEVGYDRHYQCKILEPRNDDKMAIGHDPIQHGLTSTGRRSTPVALGKLKYDTTLDGAIDYDLMAIRADEKFAYESNKYFMMYDFRPTDPLKYFEWMAMMCIFLGCQMHLESQKNALAHFFHANGMGKFIMTKFKFEHEKPDKQQIEGTHATSQVIQDYTTMWASYIEYFGHTIPFIPLLEDNLVFDPKNTTDHDYTVSGGYTEMACMRRPEARPHHIAIENIMPVFDNTGNVSKVIPREGVRVG